MLISKITTNPLLYQNKQLSVAGVVRASYEEPFPFFMLEDQTGTLFCQTNSELPTPALTSKSTANFSSASPRNAPSRLHFSKKQAARTSATLDHAHSKHANSRHEKILMTIQVYAASILKKCRPQRGDIFLSLTGNFRRTRDMLPQSRYPSSQSHRYLPTPTKP
jgi:hypothetical protein